MSRAILTFWPRLRADSLPSPGAQAIHRAAAKATAGGCWSDRALIVRFGLVLLVVSAVTLLGWRLLDTHIQAADVEGPLHGVTYAPWAKDQDPIAAKSSGVFSFLRTAVTEE